MAEDDFASPSQRKVVPLFDARGVLRFRTVLDGRCALKTGESPSLALRRVLWPRLAARTAARALALLGVALVVGWTAVLTKQARKAPPLVSVRTIHTNGEGTGFSDPMSRAWEALESRPIVFEPVDTWAPPVGPAVSLTNDEQDAISDPLATDPHVRWFDGRPARPAKQLWMTVTAYSPDEHSCGDSADGMTATLHSVTTNGHRLVAADPKLFAYGTMLTVPGYDSGRIVPVLDCGSAIKGRRLDVLFPTHNQAKAWGVKKLKVTVWEYVDGLPAVNPREVR